MASDTATMWEGFPEAPFDEIASARTSYRRDARLLAWSSLLITLFIFVLGNISTFDYKVSVPLISSSPVLAVFVTLTVLVLTMPIGILIQRTYYIRSLRGERARARVTEAWRQARYPFVAKKYGKQLRKARIARGSWVFVGLMVILVLSFVYLVYVGPQPPVGWFIIVGTIWGIATGLDVGRILVAYKVRGFRFEATNDEEIAAQIGSKASRAEVKAYYDWQRQYGTSNG